MTTSDFMHEARELDARAGDGIDVRLFWHPVTDTVTVSLFDSRNQQSFELQVDPAEALEAFHHPFAYAALQGMDVDAPVRPHRDEPLLAQ